MNSVSVNTAVGMERIMHLEREIVNVPVTWCYSTYMYLSEKSLSWDSSLGGTHASCLLPRSPSAAFSGFMQRRRLWAVLLNDSSTPYLIVFLLGLACCFRSYLGNIPCSKLRVSVLSTKQKLVQIYPSFVRLLLSAKELLTWICEEYVHGPQLVFLLVSRGLCRHLSSCLEVAFMLHPKVWEKCLVVLPFFQSLI